MSKTAAPSKSVALRAYRPEDYPALLALWQYTRQRPYRPEQIERVLRSEGGVLVAEGETANGEKTVAGVLIWSHNGQVGHLWRVAVAAEFRRRGVASALVRQAEADIRASGLDGVGLLTRILNTAAQSLYVKLGYRHREDLIFWSKRFDGE